MRAINKALRIARIRKEDGGPIDVNAALPEAYQDPNVGLGAGIRNAITGLATLPQRAIENSQESLNTGNYDPSAPLEAAMTVMGGSGAVPASANELRMGIKAYHGSPHDFDAFDLSKIGTGEGAQAYGHGLYFAENPDVARSYRPTVEPGSAADGIGLKTTGKMYEVNINADPAHFLDWDKPLGQQPQAVQDAFAKQIEQFGHDAKTQAQMMIAGSRHPQGMQGVTQDLAAKGIPGIKYLDQGSRGAGQGSSNYVVFNDKLIDILRKYGIAGLPAGLAAASTQGNDDHMARGGSTRTALRLATGGNVPFAGYIPGSTGGRTDNKPINVAEGSYVIPADVLSGLGEGNSHAGAAALHNQFGMDIPTKADGGAVGAPVPIVAASGEMVVPPEKVAEIGGGDLDRGHSILDALVKHVRKKTIKTLRKLPSPKKN